MTTTADPATLEPHEQEVTTRVLDATSSLVDDANAVLVRDDEEAEAATDFLSLIAGERKRATEARRFLVDPLNAHVKAINERFRGPEAIFKRADEIVRAKVLAYRAEQERRRQAEVRRLEAEEQERLRAERAERERQEAEARALAERAAAVALAAETADSPVDLADAARDFAAATAALEQQRASAPAPVALPIRTPAPRPTLGAAASRKRWVATVTDASLVPRQYLVVDQRLLNEAVKRGAREIPGVTIEERDELAVRAR